MDVRKLIPNPCPEDFSKMSPTEKGAFCSKCQFEVMDFEGMTTEQILAYLRNANGQKVCGRIKVKTPWWQRTFRQGSRWYAIAAGFIMYLWSNGTLQAQSSTDSTLEHTGQLEEQQNRQVISGVVLDKQDSLPLPFATIIAFENNRRIGIMQTDTNGEFSFTLPRDTESSIDLVTLFVGFQNVRIKGANFAEQPLRIMLPFSRKPAEEIIVGTVKIVDIHNPSTGSHWDGNTMIGGTGPID